MERRNKRICCNTPAYKPWEQDPTLYRCVTCGNIRYYGPETVHCVICEKQLMKNRDLDEMSRLQQAGVLVLRYVKCSYGSDDEPDQFGNRVQYYPVCGECIEKERVEEEEGGGRGEERWSRFISLD